jgi:drug/metabolite transporter (DMT)-like permease
MIGCIVLHENFSILDVTYSILCFVGLLLVSKPSFLFNEVVSGDEYQRSFAVACALAAALMSAMAYITVRKVGQGTHVMVHVVYFGLVTALFSVPILLLQFQTFAMPVEKRDIELLVAIGILAFLGQYFINLG